MNTVWCVLVATVYLRPLIRTQEAVAGNDKRKKSSVRYCTRTTGSIVLYSVCASEAQGCINGTVKGSSEHRTVQSSTL